MVGGLKWFSKDDSVSLNILEINFSKREKGKLSRQDAVGKTQ